MNSDSISRRSCSGGSLSAQPFDIRWSFWLACARSALIFASARDCAAWRGFERERGTMASRVEIRICRCFALIIRPPAESPGECWDFKEPARVSKEDGARHAISSRTLVEDVTVNFERQLGNST